MAKYYPVMLDLKGKKCVLFGGGPVGERKAASLVNSNAIVTVVSPDLTYGLRQMVKKNKIDYKNDIFEESYFEGAFLVIGATGNKEINHRIFLAASKNNKLINIVDDPGKCNFIVPSVVEKGDLLIGISSSGKSPAFAKKIRKQLENQFEKGYKEFLIIMGELRKKVAARFLDKNYRSEIFQALVDSDMLDLCKKGFKDKATTKAEEILKNYSKK